MLSKIGAGENLVLLLAEVGQLTFDFIIHQHHYFRRSSQLPPHNASGWGNSSRALVTGTCPYQ